jgi:hypothetical protein
MIEIAYELGYGCFCESDFRDLSWEKQDELYEKCRQFGRGHKNNKARLLAIMENIIENKGTFKP